ncbi:MAG: WD40/YVTN/BNR-like repeat-containing protein [Acidimicrobiia bacterium]
MKHRWKGVALAALMVAASCSGGSETPTTTSVAETTTTTPSVDVPAETATVEEGFHYAWKPLRVGAGGWVTGLVVSTTAADVRYARTDVGGAYRWNAEQGQWVQMLTAGAVPDAAAHGGDYSVEAIAVSASDPNVVYVSVGSDFNSSDPNAVEGEGRVLHSADGGRTWTASSQAFFISGNQVYRTGGERLAVDPVDAGHVVLGTRRQGIWTSRDGGASWTQVSPDVVPVATLGDPAGDQPGVTFVVFDESTPTRVYAGVAGVGVYRSDDGGDSWSAITDEQDHYYDDAQVVDGRLAVVVTSTDTSIPASLRSYDASSGAWSEIEPPVQSYTGLAMAIDPTQPGRIVVVEEAVRDGHVWRTDDSGGNWTQLDISISSPEIPWLASTDIDDYMTVGRLVFDPLVSGRLWFGEGMGMWRVDDVSGSELVWQLDSVGIEQTVTSELIAPAGGDPVSAIADRQGFKHADPDQFPSRPLVDRTFVGGTDLAAAGQVPGALVWVGAEYQRYYSDDRVARGAYSHDGGETWTEFPNLPLDLFGGEVAVSATDPSNIVWVPTYLGSPDEYQSAPKGVYVTKDEGGSWTKLDDVGGTNAFHRYLWWLGRQALAADTVEGGVFYLMSDDGQFFVSTDGGSSWTEAANSPPCTQDVDCHVVGQLRAAPGRAGDLWAGVGNGGLVRSTDRGASPWTTVSGVQRVDAFGFGAPMTDGGYPAIFLYGRANDDPQQGLFRSTDEGATWELIARFPDGLYKPVNVVSGDLDLPGRVYVGFGGTGFVYGDDAA